MHLKHFTSPLIALALILGITGCTGNKNSEASKTVLTIGLDQEFESLNPTISQMAASSYISHMMIRNLVTIGTDWQWKCVLCKEIPTFENKKARFITENGTRKIIADWEIVEAAVWGDGTPVTGHDVAFGWEVGAHPNVSVGQKEVYTRIESITVDQENPKKFTIKFEDARYNYYQLGTFYVLPKHLEGPAFEASKDSAGSYEKQTLYTTNPTNAGLYNGPFVLEEWKLGSHVILKRNPKFWGTPAKLEKIIVRIIPNNQALEANLFSGAVQMIGELGFPLDQALALEKKIQADPKLSDKIQVTMKPGLIYEHIDFNLRNPMLQDRRVRQALVYGADRAKLTQALFEGRQNVAHSPFHPLDVYHTEELTKYEYNPEKAASLLDEAGWILGPTGVRSKDGQRLSVVLMSTAQNKTRELVQAYIQEEWKKIGVETVIRNEPARVFFGETVRKGAYPHLALFAWVSSPDSPPESTLHSKNIPTEANSFAGQNSGAFSNKRIDQILDQVKYEFDIKKRQELMKELAQIYSTELPTIPLYHRVEISVTPSNLKGYEMSGHQFYSTQSVENWYLE
jgi:peptide/nickel transport system substrate-binding protein